jgi:flagellin-specific chaperone FliS
MEKKLFQHLLYSPTVSNLITRYVIFKTIYLQATLSTNAKDGLRQSLVKLYTVVLEYLCKAQLLLWSSHSECVRSGCSLVGC